MRSINTQMLVKYTMAMVIVVSAIGATVSWRLDGSISKQADIINEDLANHNNEVLASYHKILNIFINDVKKDIRTVTKDISNNQTVRTATENKRSKLLIAQLATISQQKRLDFAIVLDKKGKHLASFPSDVDTFWLDNYYETSNFGPIVKRLIENGTTDDFFKSGFIAKAMPDFLKAIKLSQKDISGKGVISVISADTILDDFGDSIGVSIAGKLLNTHSDNPVKRLYDSTGSSGVIYHEGDPMAFAGFDKAQEKKTGFDPATLTLNAEIQKDILNNPDGIFLEAPLANEKYLAKCSQITSFDGEKIGIVLVGVLKSRMTDITRKLIASGMEAKREVQTWIIKIALVAILLFTIGSLQVSKGIIRPISSVIAELSESATQVTSAAIQFSSSSQSLAEGASDSASSLEETSSALVEVAAMTQRNAGNAKEANTLMEQAEQVVVQANQSMNGLNTSMNEISAASEKTSKIIKTIDEIAFQTNLLALNAAVEAARAGEAGAGFAVVADEVRNLAMRAADAAKSTSELIEGTVNTITDGSKMVTATNDIFSHMAESISKVGKLVAEISIASKEQAQVIEQLNNVVSGIDKVTQQNALVGEESANTSDEMSSQAEQMKSMVAQLEALVGGNNSFGVKRKKPPALMEAAETSVDPIEQLEHKVKL